MADKVGALAFELSFDGSKMLSSINANCKKLKNTFEQSFKQAGKTGTKEISSSNEKIKKILSDTEKTVKSKAASIAAVYRNEGYSQEEAFKKAWKHIEREGSSGSEKIKKSLFSIRKSAKKTASGMENDFSKSFHSVSALAKRLGVAVVAAFGIRKIVDFGKSCTKLGSDLQEVQNVVDVTFPHMTAQVDKFAKSAAAGFGLSETMAKRYTGTFGAMAKSFGFTEKEAYEMSASLTGLAGDVASFYNITQDEAYTKLKSVFTGETETLKELGVVMTQSALDAYALANGYGKTTKAMSEMEKVALRYAFVQNQLSAASGDFIRTSDSWANQVRILKLNFESLKATIGQGLINVLTPVLKVINSILAKLMTLASAFKSFTELITGKKADAGGGLKESASGLTAAAGAADSLADSTSGVGAAAKKAAKEMRSLMGFDQINKLSEPAEDDNASSGSSGGSGGGISNGGVDFGSLAEGDTIVDKLDSKFIHLFETIKNGIQPSVDALKRLWNEGLAELGNFTWTALKDFYNGFLVPVGKWTLGEGIPRFVDALNNGLMAVDWGKINTALRDLWDALAPFTIQVGEGLLWFWEVVLVPLGTWTANEIVPRFLETLTNAISILNNVLKALQPLFQWFWDNVLLPIAQWTGGIFLSVWDGINQALHAFSDWCAENPGVIQTITTIIASFFAAWKITKFVTAVAPFIQTIVNIVSSIKSIQGAVFLAKYGLSVLGTSIASLVSPITIAIAAITAIIAAGVLLWKNWDTVKEKCGQLKDWVVKKFQELKENTIKHIENLKKKMELTWAAIKGVFQVFNSYLSGVFSHDWSKNFGFFGEILNSFLKNVSNIWESAKKIFSGITDFISGVFTGDWRRAWEGIKNIFGGIWEGFVGLVKSPINSIIGFLNGLVSAVASCVNSVARMLNNLRIDAPGWVTDLTGITSIGFNLPMWRPGRIPYLAQGGYVKPNTPQLAMIGDNRHQGEIVAPEGKLQEMVNAAVRAAGANGGVTKEEMELIMNRAVLRLAELLEGIGFYVDGEELAKAVERGKAKRDKRFNFT